LLEGTFTRLAGAVLRRIGQIHVQVRSKASLEALVHHRIGELADDLVAPRGGTSRTVRRSPLDAENRRQAGLECTSDAPSCRACLQDAIEGAALALIQGVLLGVREPRLEGRCGGRPARAVTLGLFDVLAAVA
jgi:hypothetical protein